MRSAIRKVGASAGRLYRTPEFTRFLFFGAVAALTTITTSWLVYGSGLFPAVPYWSATSAGATLGLAVNFSLNHLWNFQYNGRSTIQKLASFFVVSGFGIFLTAAMSHLNLYILDILLPDKQIHAGSITLHATFAANVVAVGLVALYSFPAHKFISFNVGLLARLFQLRALLAVAGLNSRYAGLR